MMKASRSEAEWLETFDRVACDLIGFFSETPEKGDLVVYTEWTVKDVLGHLVMWHESFARNLLDLIQDRPPRPLRGSLSSINEQGVAMSRSSTTEGSTPVLSLDVDGPEESPDFLGFCV